MNFNTEFNKTKEFFEKELYAFIDNLTGSDETLLDAMRYSVKAGGKRIRPVLMLKTAEMLGVSTADVMPFALAMECIHTYSLIHDDLPSMDNDDFRRGKLTSHKVYGEAMAILTGDALLNLAYEIVFRSVGGINKINAARVLSSFAGFSGMVGGQATDVKTECKNIDSETLEFIHKNKTGKLITASVLVPSCLAGDKFMCELRTYGENLGMLFQITDDILDATSNAETLGKSVNKDEKSGKLTYVTLYGLTEAKNLAVKIYNETVKSVSMLTGNDFLLDLAEYVLNRKS